MGKGFVSSVKDMEVFKRSYVLSLEIHRASLNFPKHEQHGLADQLRRASKSVCANLVEGFAKQVNSKREFGRYVAMSLGSCNEALLWLRYAQDLDYLPAETGSVWRIEYEEVARMLNRLYKTVSPS